MNWRSIGDTTLAAFEAEIRARAPQSPLLGDVRLFYELCKPHTRLALGMLWVEDRFQTDPSQRFPLSYHNAFNMKTPDGSGWMRFNSYPLAARSWVDRITSDTYKDGIYAETTTLPELVHVYAPASDSNDEEFYVRTVELIVAEVKQWERDLGGTDVAIAVDIELVNRGFGALQDSTPLVTIHNTGAGNARSQERQFVANGGGAQGVAYHFAVDETGITQIMPLWQRGVHAGNVDGNLRSIAIEMCMNREPWSAVKENTAQLLAMLHTRDERLDWTGAEGFTYTLAETTEHRKWPGANPDCPQRLIATDGGYPVLVTRAKEIVAGTKPPKPSKVAPHPIGGEADGKGRTREINGTLWLWVNKMFFMEKDVQAYEYANLASRKGPKYKGGKNIRVCYVASGDGANGDPELFGTTRLGWRLRMKDLI